MRSDHLSKHMKTHTAQPKTTATGAAATSATTTAASTAAAENTSSLLSGAITASVKLEGDGVTRDLSADLKDVLTPSMATTAGSR